jgi:flagellar hook assembly protein FlgD
MPLVVVTELEYNEETQRLLAATYGRSMFWYDLDEAVSTNESPTLTASLKAYPNPFTDIFTLEINNSKDQQVGISVYNMEGKLIFSSPAVNLRKGKYDWPMDGSQWPSGKYQVVIQNGNENTSVGVVKK